MDFLNPIYKYLVTLSKKNQQNKKRREIAYLPWILDLVVVAMFKKGRQGTHKRRKERRKREKIHIYCLNAKLMLH